MEGINNGTPIHVTSYPVAWRIEVANEGIHRGFEYVRSGLNLTCHARMSHRGCILAFTGDLQSSFGTYILASKTTAQKWDTAHRCQWVIANRFASQVHFNNVDYPFQVWRLVPVNVKGVSTPSQSESSGSLPPYIGGATGQSSAHTHHAESESDDFGTIVTEITTSTVTTRKRYRVEDA